MISLNGSFSCDGTCNAKFNIYILYSIYSSGGSRGGVGGAGLPLFSDQKKIFFGDLPHIIAGSG